MSNFAARMPRPQFLPTVRSSPVHSSSPKVPSLLNSPTLTSSNNTMYSSLVEEHRLRLERLEQNQVLLFRENEALKRQNALLEKSLRAEINVRSRLTRKLSQQKTGKSKNDPLDSTSSLIPGPASILSQTNSGSHFSDNVYVSSSQDENESHNNYVASTENSGEMFSANTKSIVTLQKKQQQFSQQIQDLHTLHEMVMRKIEKRSKASHENVKETSQELRDDLAAVRAKLASKATRLKAEIVAGIKMDEAVTTKIINLVNEREKSLTIHIEAEVAARKKEVAACKASLGNHETQIKTATEQIESLQVLSRDFSRSRIALQSAQRELDQSIDVQMNMEREARKKAIEGCNNTLAFLLNKLREQVLQGMQILRTEQRKLHDEVFDKCNLQNEEIRQRIEAERVTADLRHKDHITARGAINRAARKLSRRHDGLESRVAALESAVAEETARRIMEELKRSLEQTANDEAKANTPSIGEKMTEALVSVYAEIKSSDDWLKQRLSEIEFNLRVELERGLKRATGTSTDFLDDLAADEDVADGQDNSHPTRGSTRSRAEIQKLREMSDRHAAALLTLEEDFRAGFDRLAAANAAANARAREHLQRTKDEVQAEVAAKLRAVSAFQRAKSFSKEQTAAAMSMSLMEVTPVLKAIQRMLAHKHQRKSQQGEQDQIEQNIDSSSSTNEAWDKHDDLGLQSTLLMVSPVLKTIASMNSHIVGESDNTADDDKKSKVSIEEDQSLQNTQHTDIEKVIKMVSSITSGLAKLTKGIEGGETGQQSGGSQVNVSGGSDQQAEEPQQHDGEKDENNSQSPATLEDEERQATESKDNTLDEIAKAAPIERNLEDQAEISLNASNENDGSNDAIDDKPSTTDDLPIDRVDPLGEATEV